MRPIIYNGNDNTLDYDILCAISQENALLLNEITAWITELPVGQKDAMSLLVQDFSREEIADHLGISSKAVEMRIYKARKKLQRYVYA